MSIYVCVYKYIDALQENRYIILETMMFWLLILWKLYIGILVLFLLYYISNMQAWDLLYGLNSHGTYPGMYITDLNHGTYISVNIFRYLIILNEMIYPFNITLRNNICNFIKIHIAIGLPVRFLQVILSGANFLKVSTSNYHKNIRKRSREIT